MILNQVSAAKIVSIFLNFLLTILTLSYLPSSVYGQNNVEINRKAIKLYEEAELLFKQRQFEGGIALLQKAIEKDSNFADAHLRLASAYKTMGKIPQSYYHLEKAIGLKPASKEMGPIYITIGEHYLSQGKYDSAEVLLKKAVNYVTTGIPHENAHRSLDMIKFAKEAMKDPLTFTPQKMDNRVNKFYMQAYPVLTADQNFFIYSERPGDKYTDDEDIVISERKGESWGEPKSISPLINTDQNEGTSSISGDGKTLVFTSCNKKDGLGACDIYISYKTGEEWSTPLNLGSKVNSAQWESEPSLSADGRTIYFSSDRKGGYGGEDIYYTTLANDGTWSTAKNIGKSINTRYREVAPFIHANGKTLFFSSTGHLGMGGFDIFYSKLTDSSWSSPKNVGYPINDFKNNNSIFIAPDNRKAYYSVDESDGNKYTRAFLYSFDLPIELKRNIDNSTVAVGKVFDAVTRKELGAAVELVDLKTDRVVQSVKSDPINGAYVIVLSEGAEYALYVYKEGYLFKSVFFDYKNEEELNTVALDVYLDPIKAGASVILNNLFFATNSFALESKSKTELKKISNFLKQNPNTKIELAGHTDNVGGHDANIALSEKRAKSVYDYLVTLGTAPSRLVFKGYGETKPIAGNTTEENKQKNRRIEFKIL
jgi:outer membrane protein OmpA-like peptidoglycan-associated protein/tetratricopeptide (TPR) repeat protein